MMNERAAFYYNNTGMDFEDEVELSIQSLATTFIIGYHYHIVLGASLAKWVGRKMNSRPCSG
jgi:hypothetical protein